MTSQRITSSPTGLAARDSQCAIELVLHGCVQGIGVRPAIARLARELELTGCVSNQSHGVVIHIEGATRGVERFCQRLAKELPSAAAVTAIDRRPVPMRHDASFRIVQTTSQGPLSTHVPGDRAVCGRCLEDVFNAENRRFGYPFTSCTDCGPRYSIVETMPWERTQSSMWPFPMCAACGEEFELPRDRRFHAQTNACAACGPRVWLTDSAGHSLASGDAAVRRAADALQDGRIVAVKGLGGYQLLCDATSESAVRELRRRKGRASKPLAVMVETEHLAESLAQLDRKERTVLHDSANPIILLRRHPTSPLATAVSPGLNTVGLLLPTTPLHALLLRETRRPLVVTSGNREGEPLEFQIDEAASRLNGLADFLLHHDRDIRRPIDDSVIRLIHGRRVTIRAARGLAPLPLALSTRRHVLALGGHQKAAVALTNGSQAVLGPHIGDLNTTASRERFVSEVGKLLDLYEAKPELVVHDLHPDYFTTTFAQSFGVPTLAVQHHHAHVAAAMLEHGWLNRTVLGVAFDGTGYGTDGTIWGGEFQIATIAGFQRVGHLRPFRLPGGEAAIREPWRIAMSLVHEACGPRAAQTLFSGKIGEARREQVCALASRPHLSPATTSAGRLFDGIAALVLETVEAGFEGEPAMHLEAVAEMEATGCYDLDVTAESPFQLDWRPMIQAVLKDVADGVPSGIISLRFHRGLANGIAAVARRFPEWPIVLSGGVFQNKLLVELCAEAFATHPQPVGFAGAIPPNDGGLAAGQLAVGVHHLDRLRDRERSTFPNLTPGGTP